jgi:hypothetical protein
MFCFNHWEEIGIAAARFKQEAGKKFASLEVMLIIKLRN